MKSYVFKVAIEPDKFEDGRDAWHAFCPALKGCHTWGHTHEEALANLREAIDLYVQDLIEAGEQIPVDQGTIELLEPAVVVNVCRFIRALEGDGFALQRVRGSHRIYRHADGRRVVVAYHALNETFPIGTLRAMIADAGWQDEDLRRLGLLD